MVTKTCSVPHLIQDSTDKTFTSGVGLVVGLMKQNLEEDPEFKAGKKLDLWIQDRLVKSFNVKYILLENPKLVTTHIMIRVGREFTFDGYLSRWDLKERPVLQSHQHGWFKSDFQDQCLFTSIEPSEQRSQVEPKSSIQQPLAESGDGSFDRNVTPIPFPLTSNAPLGTSLEMDQVEAEPIPVSGFSGKGQN
ncbi:hypothetical protein PGTUg99_002107 [Puccinia graminis f. sp. tritici]|nr:hypothetical protein PGTUg99_002107 [Puccinia graminis f. sp. tritici]